MKISFNNIGLNQILNLNNSKKVKVSNSINYGAYPNLAPLNADTISFSGRAKLIGGDMKNAPPENICRKLNENAEPARYLLECIFDKYLGSLKSEKMSDNPKEKPVKDMTTRRKSSGSIREKVVSKYSKITRDETNRFSNQVIDELCSRFNLSDGVTKEMALDDAKRITKYSFSENIKIPPYENIELFFDEIVAELQLLGRFDFASVPEDGQTQIFDDIKAKLYESNDSTHHIGTRYIDPTIVGGVKHYANDIVGGRIIIDELGPEYSGLVIEALKHAVEDGMLKITSIENNVPDPTKLPTGKRVEDYAYATNRQLNSLAKTAGVEVIENKSKSGYLAVHINIVLENELLDKYNGVFKGFEGEIQIIGEDVLALKKVEDMCYKLKDNKNAIHEDYRPFKEYFMSFYNESPDVQKAFDDYTYSLYLAQRSIPPGAVKRNNFLTIKELGFEGKVPEELDFNNLKKIKESCDIIHEATVKKQELADEQKKSEKAKMQSIKSKSDVVSVKELIRFKYHS